MDLLANFIANRSVPARSGRTLEVFEPATGRAYAQVASSDAADVADAVAAARAAYPAWSATPAAERSRLLLRLADLIDRDAESLAQAESRDTGKPLALCRRVDIPRAAANLRFFATAILHTSSALHETEAPAVGSPQHALNYTLRRPRGVAGLISPWNLPLYLLTWKIAPALATGNTAVCKPSEITPATASLLGPLAAEAGLPPGVLNIVHGPGPDAGAPLVTHADVPTLSFTGSTPVGRWIAQHAGHMLKRVSLELGGKNAFIVFPDADFDHAVELAAAAAFTNQGQICLCGSRLLVERSIADRFSAALVERVAKLRLGDPLDPHTDQGALTSRQHLDKVARVVDQARTLGGRILCGGSRPNPDLLPPRCRDGYFYSPTLIAGLDPACEVEQQEIFGPVASITAFEEEPHALALANGTTFGLAATLLTRDLARAHRVAAKLDVGIVWINTWLLRDLRTPFGGTKHSGVGREGGTDALHFFTEPKNVCIGL